MKRVATRLFCLFVFSALACNLAIGQGSTAQISGSVSDSVALFCRASE